MIFQETRLDGAYVIDLDLVEDGRGFFARAWCQREFEAHGLNGYVAQANVSRSRRKGLIRGIHYQVPPHAEAKTVRCTRGGVYDVIVDLRPDSRTYRQWLGVELTEGNGRMLYVPEGFGHGYQSLTDVAEVAYLVSEFYEPAAERGVRFDDPAFAIEWPLQVGLISEKDASWPAHESTEVEVGDGLARADAHAEGRP